MSATLTVNFGELRLRSLTSEISTGSAALALPQPLEQIELRDQPEPDDGALISTFLNRPRASR